jgi:hypothetical protein
MLKANQDKLNLLAAVLLEQETVEGGDIRKIPGLPERRVRGDERARLKFLVGSLRLIITIFASASTIFCDS